MPTHIQGASSQKLEVVDANEIYYWKADDIDFTIKFYIGGPFSFGCTHIGNIMEIQLVNIQRCFSLNFSLSLLKSRFYA